MNNNVTAVIVTYNTAGDQLDKVLSALSPQCIVIVVDNSSDPILAAEIGAVCGKNNSECIALGDNFGIAYAQNIGIKVALKRGALDILLMDDDSIAPKNLVQGLIIARSKSSFEKIVISARTVDKDGSDISNRCLKTDGELMQCTELTSSGTLISADIFDKVGFFDESLFIDCVDFDWGWRALSIGFPLMLSSKNSIQHRLGQGERFGFKIPSPIRHYYQYRNVSIMIFRFAVPWRWRLQQAIKLPIKLFLIMLFADRPWARLRYACLGLYDAFIGRAGRFNH